jgi:hypothetical protein
MAADLLVEHEKGAVLYLGGYFRTRLRDGLERQLQSLGQQQVVAIDHGALVPELDNREAVRELKNAFRHGLVDIYICTFDELWSLARYGSGSPMPAPEARDQQLLRSLVEEIQAPEVTVVRGEDWPGRGTAFTIVGQGLRTEKVRVRTPQPLRPNRAGMDNAFNAGFLHSLVSGHAGQKPNDVVKAAARDGLRTWVEVDR